MPLAIAAIFVSDYIIDNTVFVKKEHRSIAMTGAGCERLRASTRIQQALTINVYRSLLLGYHVKPAVHTSYYKRL
jgi:hypothetical protein